MSYTPTVTLGTDIRPNAIQPVAAGGIAAENELYTLYQRPLPEQFDLFSRHMQYTGFATMLRTMGFTRFNSTPTVGHFEEPWLHEFITVGSVNTAAVNPGDDSIIALHANDHYDTGATISGASRVSTYPVVGDVVAITDTIQAQVTAKDTTVNPHLVTLTPLDAADNLNIVTADDEYAIIYNLWGEGTALPNGRVPRIIKYNNTMGVIKHAFGSTGHELTNSVYHEVIPGQPGSAGQSIYVKIKRDDLIRYEHSKSGFILFGNEVDNITTVDNVMGTDAPLSGTEGFVTFGRTNGYQDTYAINSYDLTNFDTSANLILDERSAATNDVIGWLGPDLFTEIENSFTNTLAQNLIYTVDRIVDGFSGYLSGQYQQDLTKEPSAAKTVLSFGYTAIHKNGFTFHMKRLSEFHDVRRLGNSSYQYRNWVMWHPLSWSMDRLSGSNRPTIGYEWKGLGQYRRDNIYGTLAGAGVGGDNTPWGKAVHEYDSMKYFLMSHCGFHGSTGNAIVIQRPV